MSSKMPQKNNLFNYFQRAKPSESSPSIAKSNNGPLKESSPCEKANSGTPKTPLFKPTPSSGNSKRSLSKGKTDSTTPKRPRPNEKSNRASCESTKSGKKFKRLRLLESDDDDSENDQSLANGKEAPSDAPAKKASSSDDHPMSELEDAGEDSEEEYKPKMHEVSSDDEGSDEAVDSAEESPVKKTPKRKPKVAITPKVDASVEKKFTGFLSTRKSETPTTPKTMTPSTPRTLGSATKSKLANFSAEGELSATPVNDQGENWPHLKLEFLRSDRLRDAAGRRPDDLEFNTRTLRLPANFLDQQTPAMRQWWVLKAASFDCVLFFKMGKFYEMFHMDAVLCVRELGLLYMKGDHAHVGFPEASYGRYSAALVEKGYKVARVEQTENPEMMAVRVANSSRKTTKFDKVVAREICQMTSRGTRTFSAVEGAASDAELNYLLAIREQDVEGELQFGVCFVDTSVGLFRLGQFSDDCHCSRLRTLLAHYPPVQVLQARAAVPQRSRDAMTSSLGTSCLRETLRPGEEFWPAEKTLRFLAETDYFREEGEQGGELQWPQTLLDMTKDGDTLHLTPRRDCDLALQCLGALTWYLQLSLLDTQLLSMRRFCRYQPPDVQASLSSSGQEAETAAERPDSGAEARGTGRMVLDGVTLRNLEIVANSVDGSTDSTLLGTLDTCVTAFGKRVLRAWLCSPLRSPAAIAARLDAVDALIGRDDVMDDLTARLKQLPDLERLVRRIQVQGNGRLRAGGSHPDSRAIMFEEAKYSRARVTDLLSALTGFRQARELVHSLAGTVGEFQSYLLRCCLTLEKDGGKFPDYRETLDFFESSFDQEQARQEGRILPSAGVDAQFDAARDTLDQVESDLEEYLRQQCRHFGCKVVYFGTAKNRYQLEVPDHAARRADHSYELQTQKKGAKRYWTETTKELLARQLAAEEARAAALRDISRRLFARFARHQEVWERAVQCLGLLDALLALARFSRGCEVSCRPELVTEQQGVLEIEEGHHPWLGRSGGGADFIPNNVSTSAGRLLLVTGPNMGGKSTLMRQAGLLVILAQLGCRVPAASLRLSPVDRVFTRLGAQDRIMSGQSTFHVELSETAAIVQHATDASLVLVDELGRGTSTFDGSAIASAVLRQLLRTGCRCLFSTHYHSLVEEFQGQPQVWLGHMACMVENECEEDPTQETITFLYKLTDGACPKSYGFNAARLAGLPSQLVRAAHQRARSFEQRVERMIRFTTLWRTHCGTLA